MANDQDDKDIEAQVLEEPSGAEAEADAADTREFPWKRGLFMILFAVLFGIGELLLGVAAILQFLFLAISREKNPRISAFGADLGAWLSDVAKFQTAVTEEKPFPFKAWKND